MRYVFVDARKEDMMASEKSTIEIEIMDLLGGPISVLVRVIGAEQTRAAFSELAKSDDFWRAMKAHDPRAKH